MDVVEILDPMSAVSCTIMARDTIFSTIFSLKNKILPQFGDLTSQIWIKGVAKIAAKELIFTVWNNWSVGALYCYTQLEKRTLVQGGDKNCLLIKWLFLSVKGFSDLLAGSFSAQIFSLACLYASPSLAHFHPQDHQFQLFFYSQH